MVAYEVERATSVIARNYHLVWQIGISPSLRLKNFLLGLIGVTVGTGVSWGLEATPDVFWPNLITLEDDAVVSRVPARRVPDGRGRRTARVARRRLRRRRRPKPRWPPTPTRDRRRR
ncbi:hypothetical protein C439_16823 [Haloferax mediterranei ATCC 33500]|uniref:Uncharacterized protein n=1 Tax=Haloferax mediterranei (strain ATCC 33500 / DSM 1411 / JCM 8866 / NBRC 14739 / NCIMB 2177 / R-4) TaxID=523841 RepID=I3R921_HALMT|nr:hypothetical protein HFX_4036 [Haloferax mediterranei ATCC 33500]ELZ97599.1 hypothetical protein C439_16823 [Haloferax mediterranei ATCC 33500]